MDGQDSSGEPLPDKPNVHMNGSARSRKQTNAWVPADDDGCQKTVPDNSDTDVKKESMVESGETEADKSTRGRCMTFRQKVKDNGALLVDVVSRIMFPTVFIIFNLIYWPYYTR